MRDATIMILCVALSTPIWADEPKRDEAEPETPEAGEEAKPESEKEPRTVNLIFQGTEADRWHLDAGGGWNDDDGLYGRLALSSSNFLGRGEELSATVEVGDEHELYELAYRRRFLFDRRQSLGVRLFKDAGDHPVAGRADFAQRRAGVTVAWGRRFGVPPEGGKSDKGQSFELAYHYADVDQRESAFGPDEEPLNRRSAYASSSLESSWVLDRLDDRVSPRRGLRLAASLEAAGGILGGEAELLKGGVGVTWFRPVTGRPLRSSFAVRTRLGWLESTGELFAQQRFFAGGEDSVRGFRRRSIAALDDDGTVARDDDGFPLGGDRLAQLNLEYHMLLGERFRLVFFADAGGVFAPGRNLDADTLRSSAGAELRVTLPKLPVPLRLIYARNLDPLPDDDFRDLSFSIGVSF